MPQSHLVSAAPRCNICNAYSACAKSGACPSTGTVKALCSFSSSSRAILGKVANACQYLSAAFAPASSATAAKAPCRDNNNRLVAGTNMRSMIGTSKKGDKNLLKSKDGVSSGSLEKIARDDTFQGRRLFLYRPSERGYLRLVPFRGAAKRHAKRRDAIRRGNGEGLSKGRLRRFNLLIALRDRL